MWESVTHAAFGEPKSFVPEIRYPVRGHKVPKNLMKRENKEWSMWNTEEN